MYKRQQQSEVLIELFSDLNSSTKISDALEKAAGRLFDAGLILSFLGGMQAGGHNLVYEVTRDRIAKFVKLGGQELKSMILANNALVGMMLSSGVFVYFEPVTPEIGDDHRFVSTVIGAISSSLRRIYMENAIHEEKDILRKALQSASEEKQKAEDSLLLNQELIDASPDGLCLVDDANAVRLENESSNVIRRRLAIAGKNLAKALSESTSSASAELKKAIESRKQTDILWQDSERSFRFETRPIRINNWMLVMISDITDELGAQRKNIAYAKMSIVGNLAASMAHNMKSPLGAIHGFGSIIKDDMGQGRIQVLRDGQKDEDFGGMIANIITGSENVIRIVNQLLNFTRKFESPEGEVDVDVFLDGILQVISPQASSSSVRLRKDVAVQTVRIRAEALEQVLINILINAVKASSQGAEVVISASQKDGGTEFAIKDTGIGMTPDQIPRIFDPLYTAWPVKTGMG
ncbi:MAG: HAMP domain-containing sensor histidine kinase, partial [Methanothrix sp.]|nr:HAMP domain-containing sensor histidine kinase [Methanothrix sp.]